MNALNRVRKSLSFRFRRWAIRGGDQRRAMYYQVASEAFRREGSAVGAGIHAHREDTKAHQQRYWLRRHVHMLEKGLTMRPRRDTFAVGYISETVDSLRRFDREGTLGGPEELDWMRSVLSAYFEATAASGSETIGSARVQFAEYLSARQTELTSGPHPAIPNDAPPVDIESLRSLAIARRSVRWFDGRPVARELVENALAVAVEAPTACNRQPYRFEIFDDPELVAEVADIPMGTRGYAGQIPGIIVVIGDLSAFFDERDRHVIYIDASLASMGLIFGLEAQGVGSCCINWPDLPDKEARMRSLLGLAPYERVVMLIAYGYADPSGLVPFSAKGDTRDIASFNALARS